MLYTGRNLAKPLPVGMWKIENAPNESVDLAKEIFRQNFKRTNWLLLTTYDEIWIEKDGLKKEKNHSVFKQNLE